MRSAPIDHDETMMAEDTRQDTELPPSAQDRAGGGGGGGDFDGAIEAIVFSAERAVGAGKIAEALTQAAVVAGKADGSLAVIDEHGVRAAVARLNAEYARTGRAFGIESVAGGYRVMTRAEFAPAVAAFHGARASSTLSRPAMETLAIVAYKQPVTRAQLEAVRGVSCGEVLRSLIDRKLITITGRAEELGRPMLYGTTKRFLEVFGLATLKELPDVDEFRRRAAESAAMAEVREESQGGAGVHDDDGEGLAVFGSGDEEVESGNVHGSGL